MNLEKKEAKFINNMNSQIIIISNPESVISENRKVVSLFKSGLQQFHVRKPEFTDFDMINYLTAIPKEYHNRLVLHSHYHLAKDFELKGIQVGKSRISEAIAFKNEFEYFGYSAHSFDEITENKKLFSKFFISPVYNSISKQGYKSEFKASELQSFISDNPDIELIALGGIDAENIDETFKLGFYKAALLGAIWKQDDPLSAYIRISELTNSRSNVLSIAGFDPCSGAGVTADIKTFEQNKVQGLGVTTAITYQNENKFASLDWLTTAQIIKQIDILFEKYKIEFVKIGLIENFETLKKIITALKKYNKDIKIIWDPILSATADFDFHNKINNDEVFSILRELYLLTPNIPESKKIFSTTDSNEIQTQISKHNLCKVLLKGGHLENSATDILIEKTQITAFEGKKIENKTKHGTGCVLSSAISSNLANQTELYAAIKKAKEYTAQFINSNNGLLGFHNQ